MQKSYVTEHDLRIAHDEQRLVECVEQTETRVGTKPSRQRPAIDDRVPAPYLRCVEILGTTASEVKVARQRQPHECRSHAPGVAVPVGTATARRPCDEPMHDSDVFSLEPLRLVVPSGAADRLEVCGAVFVQDGQHGVNREKIGVVDMVRSKASANGNGSASSASSASRPPTSSAMFATVWRSQSSPSLASRNVRGGAGSRAFTRFKCRSNAGLTAGRDAFGR